MSLSHGAWKSLPSMDSQPRSLRLFVCHRYPQPRSESACEFTPFSTNDQLRRSLASVPSTATIRCAFPVSTNLPRACSRTHTRRRTCTRACVLTHALTLAHTRTKTRARAHATRKQVSTPYSEIRVHVMRALCGSFACAGIRVTSESDDLGKDLAPAGRAAGGC